MQQQSALPRAPAGSRVGPECKYSQRKHKREAQESCLKPAKHNSNSPILLHRKPILK